MLVALEVLKRLGLSSDAVDWVALTHVHLDPRRWRGSFMRLPQASLAVHSSRNRHMADPEKLLAESRQFTGLNTLSVFGKSS